MPKKNDKEMLECKVVKRHGTDKGNKSIYVDVNDLEFENENDIPYEIKEIKNNDYRYLSNYANNNSSINPNNYTQYIKDNDYDLEYIQGVDFSSNSILTGQEESNNEAISQIPIDDYSIKRLMETLENHKHERTEKIIYTKILKILMSQLVEKTKKNNRTAAFVKIANANNTRLLVFAEKKIKLLEKLIQNPRPIKILESEVKNVTPEPIPSTNLLQSVALLGNK